MVVRPGISDSLSCSWSIRKILWSQGDSMILIDWSKIWTSDRLTSLKWFHAWSSPTINSMIASKNASFEYVGRSFESDGDGGGSLLNWRIASRASLEVIGIFMSLQARLHCSTWLVKRCLRRFEVPVFRPKVEIVWEESVLWICLKIN